MRLAWIAPILMLAGLWVSPAYSASSINTTQPADGTSYSPATIRGNFQKAANDITALQSMNAGSSPPSNPSVGTLWLQQSPGTIWTLWIWSGKAWLSTAAIDTTNKVWMPPIGGGVLPNIISSALMDVGTFPQASLNVTGSNQIQNLGNSTPPGGVKILIFQAAATLINNPPALVLPGAANIAQAVGDVAIALHQGGGNWIVLFDSVKRPDPTSLLGGTPVPACDNITDDSVAINARLRSGASNAYVGPSGRTCYIGAGISIPDGVTLAWQDFSTKNTQTSGLRCGLTAGACVTVGAGDNGYAVISNVAIFGAGSDSKTCVNYNGNNNTTADKVYCQGFMDGFLISGDGQATGIYFHGTNLYTCSISGSHIVINQAAGSYFTNPILGCDGAADVPGDSYVRIVGNWDNVKGTLHFVDPHFNLGAATVSCAFKFENFIGSLAQFIDFSVVSGHIEAAQNFICTDSSVKSIAHLIINGNSSVGGNGSNHFFALDPATEPEYWVFNNNVSFSWGDYSLSLSSSFGPSVLTMTGNSFPSLLHITSTGGGDAVIEGNNYIGGVTLDGSGWLVGNFGGTFLGGAATFSDSALKNINITLSNVACAPALQIGGSSVGISYSPSTPKCAAVLGNHFLTMSFELSVTSLGGLTGVATMSGLPFQSTAFGTPLAPMIYANMVSLTGGIQSEVNVSSHSAIFVSPAATDLMQITSGNFGACSSLTPCIIQGTITYPVQGN